MIFQEYQPSKARTNSFSYEIPFVIQTSDRSIPTITTDFCLVERNLVNLSEQHVYEKTATERGNPSLESPQPPLKENYLFTELRGENG